MPSYVVPSARPPATVVQMMQSRFTHIALYPAARRLARNRSASATETFMVSACGESPRT